MSMSDDDWRNAILQAAQQGSQSASASNPPIVPLWRVRPSKPKAPTSGAGSAAAADRYYEDQPPKPSIFATGSKVGAGTVLAPGTTEPSYETADAAEASWLDMSNEDRTDFAKKAQEAGLWKPSSGAEGLANAWSKAVASAASYNAAHPDKDKWLSPWEAVDKLAIQSLAGEGASLDGYTRTTTQAKQYSTDELYQEARQILQQELGRDPSDSELNAYTIAVNKASAAHPQTTVTTYGPVDPATGERTSAAEVQGPGFDPTKTIQDMAQDAPDREGFMASQYLQALMGALGATA